MSGDIAETLAYHRALVEQPEQALAAARGMLDFLRIAWRTQFWPFATFLGQEDMLPLTPLAVRLLAYRDPLGDQTLKDLESSDRRWRWWPGGHTEYSMDENFRPSLTSYRYWSQKVLASVPSASDWIDVMRMAVAVKCAAGDNISSASAEDVVSLLALDYANAVLFANRAGLLRDQRQPVIRSGAFHRCRQIILDSAGEQQRERAQAALIVADKEDIMRRLRDEGGEVP